MSARTNYYASFYSWIALISYADIKDRYLDLQKLNIFDEEHDSIKSKFVRDMFKVVVFSAMAVESFLNNYLAEKLGDKLYKDSFDKLSTVNKLQLVSTFIFSEDLQKGMEPYQSVSLLFTMRNEFVHNKSQNFYDNMSKIQKLAESGTEEKDIYNNARAAVKALYEIAKYFDFKDNESAAMTNLLWSRVSANYDFEEVKKVQAVQRELNVPVCII